ncbi:hypothetical protein [Acuticoccus sediminis]|nr:hypothetical protein [Acuticoccus sediminis]
MARKAIVAALAFGLATAGVTAVSAQEALSPADLTRIRDSAPNCDEHPNFPWIGRVAGNAEGIAGNSMPVSFVGCFPDESECEAWKMRTSSVVTSTLVQYSCRQR